MPDIRSFEGVINLFTVCNLMGLLNVTSGANPVAVKKGIDKTVAALIEALKEKSRPVQGRETIKGNKSPFSLQVLAGAESSILAESLMR